MEPTPSTQFGPLEESSQHSKKFFVIMDYGDVPYLARISSFARIFYVMQLKQIHNNEKIGQLVDFYPIRDNEVVRENVN